MIPSRKEPRWSDSQTGTLGINNLGSKLPTKRRTVLSLHMTSHYIRFVRKSNSSFILMYSSMSLCFPDKMSDGHASVHLRFSREPTLVDVLVPNFPISIFLLGGLLVQMSEI